MQRDQPFSDVDQDITSARGVLDGDAFRDHERVIERANVDGHGFDFQVRCGNCGKPTVTTIFWPELVVASMGVLPADMHSNIPWQWKDGYMYPPVRCGCGTGLPLPLTPDKCARFIQTGIRMGRITQAQVAQQQALVNQQRPRR